MIKAPQNILNLSPEEKQKFLDSFDYVFADCDGVMWTLTDPIPGIAEGIQVLSDANKQISFVSNNSVRSKENYCKQFADMNVKFDYDKNLVHPASSVVAYLKKIKFDGNIFAVGSEHFKKVLTDNDFKIITAPENVKIGNFGDFYKKIFTKEPIHAIVFDFDLSLNLSKFYSCQYYLQKYPDCMLIYGMNDSEIAVYDKLFVGMEGFMDLLAEKSKRKPIVLGKPGADLGDIIIEKYQIKDKSRVLFIGDTLDADIEFANKIGFQTLLVLTGVTTKEMLENNKNPANTPNYFTNSVRDFAEFAKANEITAL